MPAATRTHAQQAAARANGARSHGPATEAGRARSAVTAPATACAAARSPCSPARTARSSRPCTPPSPPTGARVTPTSAARCGSWSPRCGARTACTPWSFRPLPRLQPRARPPKRRLGSSSPSPVTVPGSTRTLAARCRPCASCATDPTPGSTECKTARPNPTDHVRQRGVKWLVVEVTIGQAALGGICAGSASAVGAASSAMPSSCM
jgi:hypothetical protein